MPEEESIPQAAEQHRVANPTAPTRYSLSETGSGREPRPCHKKFPNTLVCDELTHLGRKQGGDRRLLGALEPEAEARLGRRALHAGRGGGDTVSGGGGGGGRSGGGRGRSGGGGGCTFHNARGSSVGDFNRGSLRGFNRVHYGVIMVPTQKSMAERIDKGISCSYVPLHKPLPDAD